MDTFMAGNEVIVVKGRFKDRLGVVESVGAHACFVRLDGSETSDQFYLTEISRLGGGKGMYLLFCRLWNDEEGVWRLEGSYEGDPEGEGMYSYEYALNKWAARIKDHGQCNVLFTKQVKGTCVTVEVLDGTVKGNSQR